MLKLHLHDAQLVRSFAKVGFMDPYVIVAVEENEVHRTAPAKWSHKSPQWESVCTVKATSVPSNVTLAVWDANRLHKDVFCGSVTIPLCADMVLLEKEFALTKRGAQTGTVRISLEVLEAQQSEAQQSEAPALPHASSSATVHSALGGEMDNLAAWVEHRSPKASAGATGSFTLSLAEPGQWLSALSAAMVANGIIGGKDDKDEAEQGELAPTLLESNPEQKPKADSDTPTTATPTTAPVPESEQAVSTADSEIQEVLCTSWTCVATTGLEEFLKHTGVGTFQRKLAMAARWPAWEFTVRDGSMHFLNHSAMGDLHEDIRLDGQPYQWKDGRGNLMTCTASWEKTSEGGVLRIARTGALATYSEERRVEGDTLTFSLTSSDGATWGRVFTRA